MPDRQELEDDTEPDVLGISRHQNTLVCERVFLLGGVLDGEVFGAGIADGVQGGGVE